MNPTQETILENAPLESALLIPPMPPQMQQAFEQWRKEYHTHMGQLSRQGMARKAVSGVLPCCAPVGYKNVSKRIEVDPVLAPLVQEAFARAAVCRLPLRALLAEMTRKGLVSRNGKPMQVSGFWYMLKNPFYRGLVNWKGELIPGSHEPLISQELFQTVLERIRTQERIT